MWLDLTITRVYHTCIQYVLVILRKHSIHAMNIHISQQCHRLPHISKTLETQQHQLLYDPGTQQISLD